MFKKRPYRKIVYREKINILLVQIVNRNLGDMIIAENAEYLVRRALPCLARQQYVLQRYDIQSEDYERVKAADMIIFDGGGLIKYKQEDFHKYVPDLLEYANEHQIPVFFNSVGVEGYDAQDMRCIRLAQTLNYDCVKGITVRDDLETLQRNYLMPQRREQIVTTATIDSAVFTPKVYGIQKKEASHTIGLGIVRWRIFEDYGLSDITREFQLELWQGITKELEKRGYQWQFFVNGLRSDYDFAMEILAYMGRKSQAFHLLAPRPVEARELVETIASFEGVIACRMHANIIAYAIGVPSVGLVWNDKMVFWSERIGYPERFLTSGQFKPDLIVQRLVESMSAGVRPCPQALKNSIQKPLQKFVRTYSLAARKKKRWVNVQKPADWQQRLVAVALGGMHMRYTNMNTQKGLTHALEQGFCILEADIRLTTDGVLVCVNGWSKGSYEKLGVDPGQYEEGMDYDTFMKCRMYDSYETMDAVQLFAQMREQSGDWKLILDIGKPKKEILDKIIGKLQELCAEETDWRGHLFLRLQSRYDVEKVQEANLAMELMFYVPPKQNREARNLTLESIGKYCKKRGVKWLTMPKEALDEEVMAYLRKEKLKSCVFSFNRYTEVLDAISLGVDWIATSYLSPAELDSWYSRTYTIVIR